MLLEYSWFLFVCLFACFFNFGYLSVIVLLVLSAAGIVILVSFVCPLVDGDKRLMQASWWKGLAVGKPGSCSGGQGYAQFSPVQPLSHIQLSATSWSATHQASLSIINTQSLLTLMSIKWVILSHPVIPFSSCL